MYIAGACYYKSRIGRVDYIVNGREVILCLGDSFTFGIGAEKGFSYPDQLSRILEARQCGRYKVINSGIPGSNSSMIAKSFKSNIYTHSA